MSKVDEIGITQLEYLREKDSEDIVIDHPDARVMDKFSKACFFVSRRLYSKVRGEEVPSERIAVVLATNTGPYQSIKDLHTVLTLKSQIGINPSMFPNIMMTTPLARIIIALKIYGPSVPMYLSGKMHQAIQYGIIQLIKGICDGVMVIYADEGKGYFGLYLEYGKMACQRGLKLRFMLDKMSLSGTKHSGRS